MASDELWRLVEARHDDGTPAMFRIRDLVPRRDQPRIFVVELPYPTTELSRLPDAAAYRRLGQFEEQWVRPAAAALDLTFVAAKTDDGSFFLYLYGAGEPRDLIERLSPFDGALGFFDEHDPGWDEYAALRELLAQAKDLEPEPASKPATSEAAPATDATIDEAAPKQTTGAKKPATKTPAAKKPVPKKPVPKKPAAKKPAAKKLAARKPAAKKRARKRT